MSLVDGRDAAESEIDFLDRYVTVLPSEGVALKYYLWYRRHVAGFVRARRGTPLAEASHRHVEAYLRAVVAGGIPAWKLRLLVRALRICFLRLHRVEWYRSADWEAWASPGFWTQSHRGVAPSEHGGAVGKGSDARQGVAAAFASRRPELFERFVRIVRTRGFSLRTERTYAECIGHLLRFHGWSVTDVPEVPTVVGFLEHLAVERKLSASTQRVALDALTFFYREVLRLPLDGLQRTACSIRRRPESRC